ncbi:MAG TPA: ABC transporter permease [Verrucomicrobia bacterium]|nr:ABC transporter permease [Verrucomicrobiota bacterium]
MRKQTAWLIFIGTTALLALLFLWPIWRVISGGYFVDGHFTWKYLAGVFDNPIYAEGLWNSLFIGLGTTSLTMLLALPLAWLAHRYDFAGKTALTGLLLVPMILPPFVGAIGFQQILGPYGALNALLGLGPVDWLGQGRYFGVILLQALSLYPILYLNAVAALSNIDPSMEEAAANLGCSGFRKFRRITLPLMMPGLFAGGTIVFIWSFTELGTPLIMNYTRCAPVQVYDALKEIGSNPFPYALVSVMLTASVLLYAVSRLVFGRHAYAMQGKATRAAIDRPLTGWRAIPIALPFLAVIALALLPHAGVILTSFSEPGSWYRTILPSAYTTGNYVEALGHSMTVSSIRNSLFFASLSVLFDLFLGIAIAFVVVRSSLRFRGVLDALSMIPLAVPGLVMAFGFLSISSLLSNLPALAAHPFWLSLVDVRTNPTLFLVVAYAVRRLPYMVRSAVAGLQQTSPALEEAAANLGAPPLTVARRITLPLIMANLIAGTLLAFAFSMLEVSDSLMLAQRADYFPITKAIYELFQLIGTGKYIASALGVWAMLFLAVTIVGSSVLLGKKLGALFRV